jgi:hypothetical protein
MSECVPNGYAYINAWPLKMPAHGAVADPPAGNATPDHARPGIDDPLLTFFLCPFWHGQTLCATTPRL